MVNLTRRRALEAVQCSLDRVPGDNTTFLVSFTRLRDVLHRAALKASHLVHGYHMPACNARSAESCRGREIRGGRGRALTHTFVAVAGFPIRMHVSQIISSLLFQAVTPAVVHVNVEVSLCI